MEKYTQKEEVANYTTWKENWIETVFPAGLECREDDAWKELHGERRMKEIL